MWLPTIKYDPIEAKNSFVVEEKEVKKCRHRVVSFCRGAGLDLGCGDEKIASNAIGIDIMGKGVDISIDLGMPDALRIFADNSFDYVFSSHCLEEFENTKAILHQWWRLIKPSGYLILYMPDPDFCPRIGTTGFHKTHKHDLYWWDVWNIIKSFGGAKKVSASRHNESNEFSWQLIVQKKYGHTKHPFFMKKRDNDQLAFPRKKKTKKDCLTIRYGALGDALWLTPVFRKLKEDGYYIVHNCTPYSAPVLRNNPNIDQFFVQDDGVIPNEDLGDYWKEIGKNFDKVINFSGSVEGYTVKVEGTPDFDWPAEKRRKLCDVNYMDRTLEVAGYPQVKGALPELYFTEDEEAGAQYFREMHKSKFMILCALSGSSLHKTYPWMPYVAGEIHKRHDDVIIVTVGEYLSQFLESWRHPNTINTAGMWSVRQSMLMTKYADLVIGPETGIMVASSCYDTPKIMFLSHSTRNNSGKYWKNCTTLHPKDCACYPCHRMIYPQYAKYHCPKGKFNLATKCAENIKPDTVYAAFLKFYKIWKKLKGDKK